MDTKKMRCCAPLLPAPGDTVVVECLDEIERLEADVAFLLDRAQKAGKCSFDSNREEGISSNSICGIAYGIVELSKQELPADGSDLMACKRMFEKLPAHRKTENAWLAMANASNAVSRI